jgi:hypothetical protein
LPAPPAEFSAAGRRGALSDFRQITRELHTINPRVRRPDVEQIAEFVRSGDVADIDIAHRLDEIRILALAGVLARARNRALPPLRSVHCPPRGLSAGTRGWLGLYFSSSARRRFISALISATSSRSTAMRR